MALAAAALVMMAVALVVAGALAAPGMVVTVATMTVLAGMSTAALLNHIVRCVAIVVQ